MFATFVYNRNILKCSLPQLTSLRQTMKLTYDLSLQHNSALPKRNPCRWFKPVISLNPDKEGLSKPQLTHEPLLWECWVLFVSLACGGKSCDAVWSFCGFKGISAKRGYQVRRSWETVRRFRKVVCPSNYCGIISQWKQFIDRIHYNYFPMHVLKRIACIWIERNVFYSRCLFWLCN